METLPPFDFAAELRRCVLLPRSTGAAAAQYEAKHESRAETEPTRALLAAMRHAICSLCTMEIVRGLSFHLSCTPPFFCGETPPGLDYAPAPGPTHRTVLFSPFWTSAHHKYELLNKLMPPYLYECEKLAITTVLLAPLRSRTFLCLSSPQPCLRVTFKGTSFF